MNVEIDWNVSLRLESGSSEPLYLQLKERLREVALQLDAGVLLPSEKVLSEFAGVSRETVRRALGELSSEGVLTTRRGKGTSTAARRVRTELGRVEGFTGAMLQLGRTPSTKVVSVRLEPADAWTAEGLGIGIKSRVLVVERLRLLDGQPAMLERANLPASRFPGLEKRDLTGSLYGFMSSEYGMAPELGQESIFAVNADRRLARLLDVPIAAALLASVRTSFTRQQVAIEHTLRHVRPDLCSYFVSMAGAGLLSVRSNPDALEPLEVPWGREG